MQPQTYWNNIGASKTFYDPLYVDRLQNCLTPGSSILEYGCGYGRLMELLHRHGFSNITGLDFAPNMITRGKALYPHLNLRLIEDACPLPIQNDSFDAVVMLTVLCTVHDDFKRQQLIAELSRVLKPGGMLYLSDFLVCNHPIYSEKYAKGLQQFGTHGTYLTSENLVVRHLTSHQALDLLADFDIQWFEQFDFKTMNDNPARTFHCLAKKL